MKALEIQWTRLNRKINDVYAPYMPVMTTQMLMLDDFVGRQGWATMYGKKMLNNFMYVPGTITGLNNFIQG